MFVRNAKWKLRANAALLSLRAAPHGLARLMAILFELETDECFPEEEEAALAARGEALAAAGPGRGGGTLSASDFLLLRPKVKSGVRTQRPLLASALMAVAARFCFGGDFDRALENAQEALCAAHQLNGAVSK